MFYSSHSPSDCSTSHTSSLPLSPCECPHPQPTWPLNPQDPPVSWGLGASSLNEHRFSIPLLYLCWGLLSAGVCCLFGGLVFERSQGSRLIKWDCCTLLLSFFQLSTNQPLGSAASVHGISFYLIILFIYLPNVVSFPSLPSQSSSHTHPRPFASERMLPHLPIQSCSSPTYLLHPPSFRHQITTGLGTSSPTESRQGSPLLHMCQGHRPIHVSSLVGGD